MNLKPLLALLVVGIVLLSGCTNEEEIVTSYACPDGSVVSSLIMCQKPTTTHSTTQPITVVSTSIKPTTSTATTSIRPNEIQFEDMNKELNCIFTLEDREFIINSYGEFHPILEFKSPSPRCEKFEVPSIDFSQKTLLGKYTQGTGCSIDFTRNVYKNDSRQKITYSISVVESGICEKLGISMNWILIPQIPSDYEVEFTVKKSLSGSWIDDFMARAERGQLAEPGDVVRISACEYRDNDVYYVMYGCCDFFTSLRSEDGEVICAPDGGITGMGDGRCPDFIENKKSCNLIWEAIS